MMGEGPLEQVCVHTCIRLCTLSVYVCIPEGPYENGNAALRRATEAIQPEQKNSMNSSKGSADLLLCLPNRGMQGRGKIIIWALVGRVGVDGVDHQAYRGLGLARFLEAPRSILS